MRAGRPERGALGVLLLGVLGSITLAGCGGFGYVPFLPSNAPPDQRPQPEYPLLFSPPRDVEQKPVVLTPDEQKAMEERLKNLAASREKAVRRRIERSR
jgi:hypothetical protein